MKLVPLEVIAWTFGHSGLAEDPEVPPCPLCRSLLSLQHLEFRFGERVFATCQSEDCGGFMALVFEPGGCTSSSCRRQANL